MRRGPLPVLLVLAACAASPAPQPEDRAAPARAKPGAPATVTLVARPLGDGLVELTLTARARADLDNVILELDPPAGIGYVGGALVRPLGRVAAGTVATLVARVRPSGPAEIVGGARLVAGPVHGAVATGVALGAAAKARLPEHILDTALGRVAEVRP